MARKPVRPTHVVEYLERLPEDRREAIGAVRDAIARAMPKGYEEVIQYGMISWVVPHSIYPKGYHCAPKTPVPFLSLASQKNHMAIYMFCLYMEPGGAERFAAAWEATGKKLDMGKSCVRFKRLEDVPLALVAETVAGAPVKTFIEMYESNLAAPRSKKIVKKSAGTKNVAKKSGAKKTTKSAARTSPKTSPKKTSKRITKKK